ncbi:hypothetical protein IPH92_04825 [Candidatus Kaiserbacteria bacterium]|nr:MAG: hypothetical protein IPH92_04825 [Candidatus Kaiserbacteria bacterium]
MTQSMQKIGFFLSFCVLFLTPTLSHAEGCGSIIGPRNWFDTDTIVSTPIPMENCNNPFDATTNTISPYVLKINDVLVSDNGTVEVPEGGAVKYEIEGDSLLTTHSSFLFLHDGADYRYINTKPSKPVESDFRKFAQEFFSQDTDIEVYVAAALDLDLVYAMNEDEQTAFWKYWDYVNQQYVPQTPVLRAGTYTYVIRDYDIFIVQQNFIQRIFSHLIPTAYAQEEPYIFTITFTLVEVLPTPTGISNILFLPGIMGSRLYEESDVCGSSIKERERWVSGDECDQLRMETNIAGISKYDIYTKPGDNSIVDETYSLNLYKTFFTKLNEWKEEGIITDYATVPYDWRLRLDDLLKARLDPDTGRINYDVSGTLEDGYLYQTLTALVASSTTGKVTIVAHSNGGLLAKIFLSALQNKNDPLAGKVDNLILVGVPQVGTPDALIGMLHGTEIGPGGIILSQETTRRLMSMMPFAYHLLPNQNYFNGQVSGVSTPVLTFEDGDKTTGWKNAFGTAGTDANSLYDFLRKESGRVVPSEDDLLTPAVVDGFHFQYARTIGQLLNEWTPPDTMNVYQIAGTGIDTPSGITYFTDKECVSRNPLKLFACTQYAPKLGYRVNMTIDGDATVVVSSALAMSEKENIERQWVNLFAYNADHFGFDRVHKDIFEVDDVIRFIKATIEASTTATYTYEYLSETALALPAGDRLIFYLHSPLDMSVATQEGVISSSTNTIRGATYRRYGEVQYISLPREGDENHTIVLNGQSEGSFTLEIEEWGSGEMKDRHTYAGIPSSAHTKVQMEIQNTTSIADAVLEVDYDGNGTKDIIYNTSGEVVVPVTYDILRSAIQALPLKVTLKKVLLTTAIIAEQYHEKSLTKDAYSKLEITALQLLKQQIILYTRLRLLTQTEGQNIIAIIGGLVKK